MQKLIPIAMLAVLLVGCKGGDSTAASGTTTTGGGTVSGGSSADSVTIKFAPKAGEKFQYAMNAAGTEMGMTMTAEKVEGDKVTMVTTIDSMKINGSDAPAAVMDSIKKMRVITVQDSTGKSIETKIEGAPAGTPAPDSNSPSYPSGPIKVGDTWEGTLKMGGSEVKSSYKLTKIEDQGGKQVAVIESTTTGLPGGMTQDGPSITVVEVANGMPISTDSKMKAKGADGKEQVITTSMKRV